MPGTGLGTQASAQPTCVEWINPVQGERAVNSKIESFFVMLLLGKIVCDRT